MTLQARETAKVDMWGRNSQEPNWKIARGRKPGRGQGTDWKIPGMSEGRTYYYVLQF